jgi:hypothetical protein
LIENKKFVFESSDQSLIALHSFSGKKEMVIKISKLCEQRSKLIQLLFYRLELIYVLNRWRNESTLAFRTPSICAPSSERWRRWPSCRTIDCCWKLIWMMVYINVYVYYCLFVDVVMLFTARYVDEYMQKLVKVVAKAKG